MLFQLRHLCFLLFAVGAIAQTKGSYRMKVKDGYLTLDNNGLMQIVKQVNNDVTYFIDIPDTNGRVRVKVMSGPWAGRYLVPVANQLVNGEGQKEKNKQVQVMEWINCQLRTTLFLPNIMPLSTYVYSAKDKGIAFLSSGSSGASPLCITKEPFACRATSVVGLWKYVQTISGSTRIMVKSGTSKRYEESRSQEWSHSVSASASAEFGIKSIAQVTITAGYEFRTAAVAAYSDEWATNEEKEQEVTFADTDRGKSLWQFVTIIKDDCQHEENTLLPEYALTKNKMFPPCCLPGYADDAPGYTTCIGQDSLIEKSSTRCKVVNYKRR